MSTAQLGAHLLLPPAALGSSDAAACLHITCCSAKLCVSPAMNSWISSTQRYGHSSEFWEHTMAAISLIKWPFLYAICGLHGLKHCATFICVLYKCYVLSVSPGQSWITFVRSKLLTLHFCWFIENFLLKIPVIPFPSTIFCAIWDFSDYQQENEE